MDAINNGRPIWSCSCNKSWAFEADSGELGQSVLLGQETVDEDTTQGSDTEVQNISTFPKTRQNWSDLDERYGTDIATLKCASCGKGGIKDS
jgi:hypothetical protein